MFLREPLKIQTLQVYRIQQKKNINDILEASSFKLEISRGKGSPSLKSFNKHSRVIVGGK
jgi:hypothetical protein